MTEMVEFFKLSYYSYRGGKKLHQICSATCIYRTVFELKNILASIGNSILFVEFFKAKRIGDRSIVSPIKSNFDDQFFIDLPIFFRNLECEIGFVLICRTQELSKQF